MVPWEQRLVLLWQLEDLNPRLRFAQHRDKIREVDRRLATHSLLLRRRRDTLPRSLLPSFRAQPEYHQNEQTSSFQRSGPS